MTSAKAQRISIWIIVIILAMGTVVSFFAIVLGNSNSANDKSKITQLQKQYQAQVDAQTKQLSDQYYATFNQYSSQVGKWDIGDTKDVATTDLQIGTGDTLTKDSRYTAYYIGWLQNGTTFDSSISNGALKQPLSVAPGGVISGWTKGTTGIKVGGVREITMTAAEGYGKQASGPVPANSPLRFIVMAIPTPAPIPVPIELQQYYQQQGY